MRKLTTAMSWRRFVALYVPCAGSKRSARRQILISCKPFKIDDEHEKTSVSSIDVPASMELREE